MPNVIKLMCDYHCFPLWELRDTVDGDLIDNRNPDDLPLTPDVKRDLLVWADTYDKTMNFDDPYLAPGFASPAEEEAFELEGRRLWKELQAQLSPAYKVVYYSHRERRLLE